MSRPRIEDAVIFRPDEQTELHGWVVGDNPPHEHEHRFWVSVDGELHEARESELEVVA